MPVEAPLGTAALNRPETKGSSTDISRFGCRLSLLIALQAIQYSYAGKYVVNKHTVNPSTG